MKFLSFFIAIFSTFLYADKISHTLSNQGFTGGVNTPNAQVMSEGDITLHFDNQFDNALRAYNYKKTYDYNQNYIFGAGVFSFLEIQGRLSETPGYHRDLSANIKVALPYRYKYLPNLAFGAQDVGSAANYYGNKYVVLDKEILSTRLSLGYGKADEELGKRKRMNSLFGSIEYEANSWLHLLAEDDSKEKFAAIRFEMPKAWSSSFKLNSTISTNITDSYKTNFNINLTLPFYENKNTYIGHSTNKYKQEVYDSELKEKKHLDDTVKKRNNKEISLEEIVVQLKKLSIENLTIATKESTLYLGYENSSFIHNDLDAIGVIIGLLAQSKYEKFILEQKKSKVVVFTLLGDLKLAKEFYLKPTLINKTLFTQTLKKISKIELSEYNRVVDGVSNSSLVPKIELKPFVKTFVGNEFGVFNYMLWLRVNAQLNLRKGLDVTAVGDIHINDSEIDNHIYDGFMMLYEDDTHMESVMLHQSNNILSGVNTLSIGTLSEIYNGVSERYIYNYGNHTIKLKAGYFKQYRDGNPLKEHFLGKFSVRDFYLLKYSYFIDKYDSLVEFKYGKYWNQDRGFDVKLKRFFGDTALSLKYEESRANSIFSEERDRYISLGVEFPIAFEHTTVAKNGQFKGTNAFSHSIKSTILREDGSNTLVPGGNYDPYISLSSEEYFYNRNRLQLSYIQHNAFRLIESYDKFVVKKNLNI